jgi:hypothetical protein
VAHCAIPLSRSCHPRVQMGNDSLSIAFKRISCIQNDISCCRYHERIAMISLAGSDFEGIVALLATTSSSVLMMILCLLYNLCL